MSLDHLIPVVRKEFLSIPHHLHPDDKVAVRCEAYLLLLCAVQDNTSLLPGVIYILGQCLLRPAVCMKRKESCSKEKYQSIASDHEGKSDRIHEIIWEEIWQIDGKETSRSLNSQDGSEDMLTVALCARPVWP